MSSVGKFSHKKINYGLLCRAAKSPVFSHFSFASILFFIYAASLISNFSIYSAEFRTNEILGGKLFRRIDPQQQQIPSSASLQRNNIIEEESDPLIPPHKATSEERLRWFRRKLPELEILNSTHLSGRFHGRVLELFNNNCSAQFFMVWLSAAQSFGPREFLAIDSLFSASPNGCLLLLSTSMDSHTGYKILKPLHDRGFKILAVTPDVPFLVKNTPTEPWLNELKAGNLDPGSVPLFNHLSDLLRLLVLYRYGGVYLDTDFIFIKDLSALRNAIGAQSMKLSTKIWTRLNGAVMIFDIYHPILLDFLQEFATTFNGNRWGHNGPYLVSRVLERLGNKAGHNLTIYPPNTFYPVDWVKIIKLYKKPQTEDEMKSAEDILANISSESYTVHLWNKRTRELKIKEGSVMERLISSHCVICQHITDA